MGGNEEARDVAGDVGAAGSAAPVPATGRGRFGRVPVRAGMGAVTPGMSSMGPLSAGAAWAGLVVGLESGRELEPEPEADRGCGVEGVGAVAGRSRAGGVSGGA